MTVGAIITLTIVAAQLVIIFGFVLLERRQPAATLAWLLAVALLPGVGVMLYVFFGMTKMARATRRSETVGRRVAEALGAFNVHEHPWAIEDPELTEPRSASLIALGKTVATTPASKGNHCQILVNAAATYRSIVQALQATRDHAHVQFYIIQPDRTGKAMRDRLIALTRAGIQVRVLIDAVGSLKLPEDFWDPLTDAGGQAALFSPVNPLYRMRRRDRIDFRNHRKNVVIDGRVGFTGGINVGREYLGLNPDIGHWRDTHVRIEGPAVLSLQQAFAEDWLAATGELLDERRFYPSPQAHAAEDAIVQIVDSGPDRTWSPMHRIYFQAIVSAQERVWITSPYFIPDPVIFEALLTAALRGIDVRLLLPSKSDHALVRLASSAHYPQLLEAGVRVFEYARGFVHAKTLVVDNWVGTVGSANMDMRSFHLNFELNAFVFGARFCKALADEFLDDLRDARELDVESQRNLSYTRRLLTSTARLVSPLL